MSWTNALLSYEPISKSLLELEKLDNGSPFEKEAANFYLEKALRSSNLEAPESVNLLCKAEVQKAFPNAQTQELDDMVKARNFSH